MAANVQQRNNSPSPSRNTFGSKLASIGSKLSRTFSGNESYDEERDHITQDLPSLDSPKARSVSRGREALQSTGRGGFGNIRAPSQSRERPQDGPDDFSPTRGREPVSNPSAIYSTGRGGAGNLRSPSRDVARGPSPHEKEVIQEYVATHADAPVSVGRGGLGNINRSRSRDPAATRISTGRGGAGNNVVLGEGGYSANVSDETERHHHDAPTEGYHSTGRGGFANITEKEEPALERPSISISEGTHSTGRGGAGNIQRN